MAQSARITPKIHVEYMVSQIIMKQEPNKWWVVWYDSETLGSAGMKKFDTFNEAMMWDMVNPPRDLDGVPYNRSTIAYSGV